MHAIYKYQLEITDLNVISMPEPVDILAIQIQNNVPTVWAMVKTDGEEIDVTFTMIGTGQLLQDVELPEYYLGTIQKNGFVWHFFHDFKKSY